MKKMQWKILCIVLTLTTLIGFATQIYGAESMSITVANVSGNPGDTVSVDVVVKAVPAKGISSGIFDIEYDASKIKFKELKAGDIVHNKEADMSANENPSSGLRVIYSDYDQTGSSCILKDGLFCTITFKIFDTCSGKDIDLKLGSKESFYDNDVNAISTPPTMTSGKITIGEKKFTNKMILNLDNPIMIANDIQKEIDVGYGTKPYSSQGRTFVPIRAIIQEMGGSISWDSKDKRVDVILKDTTIKLWINKLSSTVNDKPIDLDVAPHINNGRTMLPLRFVTENLGCKVDWDGKTKKITISY